jgi:hypothetical protein
MQRAVSLATAAAGGPFGRPIVGVDVVRPGLGQRWVFDLNTAGLVPRTAACSGLLKRRFRRPTFVAGRPPSVAARGVFIDAHLGCMVQQPVVGLTSVVAGGPVTVGHRRRGAVVRIGGNSISIIVDDVTNRRRSVGGAEWNQSARFWLRHWIKTGGNGAANVACGRKRSLPLRLDEFFSSPLTYLRHV